MALLAVTSSLIAFTTCGCPATIWRMAIQSRYRGPQSQMFYLSSYESKQHECLRRLHNNTWTVMAERRPTKRMDSFYVPRSQLRSRQAPADVAPWAKPCQRWRGVPFIKQIRDHATHSHTAIARCFKPGSTSKGKACSPRSHYTANRRARTHCGLSVGLRLRAASIVTGWPAEGKAERLLQAVITHGVLPQN